MSLTSGLAKLSKIPPKTKTEPKKDTFVPNFANLSEKNFDTMLYEEIPKPVGNTKHMDNTSTEYKGAIHYNDPMPMNDGNDRVARLSVLHQGDKLARQIAGSSNIKKNMEIYLQNDVYEDEYRPWWGAYDV